MESRACKQCGASLRLLRSDAKFCSTKCRVYFSRRPKLPVEMTSRRRWVRRNAAKAPLTCRGRYASSTKASTWTSFREASESSVGAGLGFVLGDGIGCWDLDHCITDGTLAPWAREAIEGIADPLFIEISQSGEGVHVFVRAPEGPGRKIREDERCIEFYSAGRYIAVTGNALIL